MALNTRLETGGLLPSSGSILFYEQIFFLFTTLCNKKQIKKRIFKFN